MYIHNTFPAGPIGGMPGSTVHGNRWTYFTIMNKEKAYKGCGWSVVAAVVLLVMLLCSCKTKDVGQNSQLARTDTCFVDRWHRDSIYIETLKHDSICIRENGDTIYVERWHTRFQDRWRDRVIHDSIYISHTDTLTNTFTVTEYKDKPLSWWQRLRMNVGGVAVWLLIGAAVFGIWKIVHK